MKERRDQTMALYDTLKHLLEAAERFETKTPQYKRIESERRALREAMTHAQLVLSVQEPSRERERTSEKPLRAVPRSRARKRT